MSRNIRSLCNTTHSNEQYVPITGYRIHNYTRAKYVNSLDLHKSPQNDEYDGRQSPKGCPANTSVDKKKCGICGINSIPKI